MEDRLMVSLAPLVRIVSMSMAVSLSHDAVGSEYPTRPVSVIGQTAPGSGPDVILRILGDRLSRTWGQQVVVFNRPGAAGLLAAQAAAAAQPDGYSLYMPTSTAIVILPETNPRMTVDFVRDFMPIGLVGETPMAIAISAKLGIASLADLIAAAKARPGEFLYAANNRGSVPHLAGAYLTQKAQISMTFVPYTGAPAALQDVLGGRVPIIVESVSALTGAVQDGSIRLLAVTSSGRLSAYPDVPTVAETIPGFMVSVWFAMLAPIGTPEAIVQKVAADLRVALGDPEVKQKFEALGVYARTMSPADTAHFMRREREYWKQVIKEAGLTPH
jgi:tripartite-type tricarboxylate transporter receptor subunit TctC